MGLTKTPCKERFAFSGLELVLLVVPLRAPVNKGVGIGDIEGERDKDASGSTWELVVGEFFDDD